MPISEARKTIYLPHEMIDRISAFRRQRDPIPGESTAIRELIATGLRAHGLERKDPPKRQPRKSSGKA
jgi:hypothetical protein